MTIRRVIIDNEWTKVIEFGESFKGKVELRKEKKYDSWVKEISGASFHFEKKSDVKQLIINLKKALIEWDKL